PAPSPGAAVGVWAHSGPVAPSAGRGRGAVPLVWGRPVGAGSGGAVTGGPLGCFQGGGKWSVNAPPARRKTPAPLGQQTAPAPARAPPAAVTLHASASAPSTGRRPSRPGRAVPSSCRPRVCVPARRRAGTGQPGRVGPSLRPARLGFAARA